MGNRVFYLDFIRAISIFLIMIFHFNAHMLQFKVSDSAIFWMKSGFEHTCLGVLGISLFIILSGATLSALFFFTTLSSSRYSPSCRPGI